MNIVVIGAHPDDCEAFCGGTASLWAKAGFNVLFVSTTNGDAGHHELSGKALSDRRALEAELSAQRGGVQELILDNHDGELMPTLEARREIVRIIRRHKADLVITHRSSDYHPDHRYTSTLVQDAAFMVVVPNFCSEEPALERNPVFLYMPDENQRRAPFQPDIAVDVTEAMETKLDMLDAMESQMYEWLPWLEKRLDEVPKDPAERRAWLGEAWRPFFERQTEVVRSGLAKWYGTEQADAAEFAEGFELCEYGHQPTDDEIRWLFPFLPDKG
jgi:LmbE family N-acetylglucosaminyl deacetylase